MFTNEDILRVALEQSAIDSNCNWEDFLKKDNVIVTSVANPSARRYLKLPHVCDLTTYGNNIVATISEEYRDIVEKYISKYAVEHCFETPNMHSDHMDLGYASWLSIFYLIWMYLSLCHAS